MNLILAYLADNWERLNLDSYGQPDQLTSMFITPRFQASGHIIAFIFSTKSGLPLFVAKVPRIPYETDRLDKEADCLSQVQALRIAGFDSIPRIISYEYLGVNRVLVETALPGQPMKPTIVRKNSTLCIESVMSWLWDLQITCRNNLEYDPECFQRLMLQPMEILRATFAASPEDMDVLDRHLSLIQSVRNVHLPLVFEHGDLSSPNILIGEDSKIKIVDWELAEPNGLPVTDLIFFLAYIAFAKDSASNNKTYLKAFDSAFFGKNAWASKYIRRFAQELGLSKDLLKVLFLQCWCRYVSGLVWRLNESSTESIKQQDNTIKFLHSNRYYILWKYALTNSENLLF
jgi:hypothetical protein